MRPHVLLGMRVQGGAVSSAGRMKDDEDDDYEYNGFNTTDRSYK